MRALWSERQNCSHNMSQKVKRIRHVSEIPHRLDRTSAGQTGHFHVTNGTHPRDGCCPEVGVSRRISESLCLLLEREELGPQRLGGVRINPPFF